TAAPPDCACTSSKCEGRVVRRMSRIAPWIPGRVWHHRDSQMEKQITLPPRDRLWRRAGGFVFALLFCWLGVTHAAGMPLNGAWGQVGPDDTPQSVLEAYRAGHLKSFDPSMLQQFPHSKRGSWVVIAAQPPWDNEERILTVYPPPMDTISVIYAGQEHPLAIDDFSAPPHGHGRLAWRIPGNLPGSAPILLRLEPSETLSAPIRFRILPWGEYLQRDAQWLVFASACFAVMLAMVLMALFSSLFMMRFCDLQKHARLLRVPIMALAVGMIQLVLMRRSGIPLLIEVAQALLNPLLMIGAVLLLVAAIVAAVRGSRQAWFFLAGWTPLLLLTAATSAQVSGALPQLDWLNDASLAGGAF